jgi:hypothetical protein
MSNHQVKPLSIRELSISVHNKIMRRITFLKFQNQFILVLILLCANLAFILSRIQVRFVSEPGHELIWDLFGDLDLSWDSIVFTFGMLKDMLPISLMISASINLVVIIYVWMIGKNVKKLINEPINL